MTCKESPDLFLDKKPSLWAKACSPPVFLIQDESLNCFLYYFCIFTTMPILNPAVKHVSTIYRFTGRSLSAPREERKQSGICVLPTGIQRLGQSIAFHALYLKVCMAISISVLSFSGLRKKRMNHVFLPLESVLYFPL